MKLITDIQDLVGKTIVKAQIMGWDSVIGVVFDDDTYCVFDRDHNYGTDLSCDIHYGQQLDLGVITQDEYDNIMGMNNEAIKAAKDKKDFLEFQRLSEKFGKNNA